MFIDRKLSNVRISILKGNMQTYPSFIIKYIHKEQRKNYDISTERL